MTPLARREARQGYLFISPWLIGFVLLTLFPMIATFFLSVTNVTLDQQEPVRFVGADNYVDFFNDKQAVASLFVTLRFAVLWLPIAIVAPFLIAVMLNSKFLMFKGAFRVLLFIPYVVPFVATVLIWRDMFGENGWVNQFLGVFGADLPAWISSPDLIYPALLLIGVWGIGAAVIINVAGLQSI